MGVQRALERKQLKVSLGVEQQWRIQDVGIDMN